ncbi:MAG: hypothetical protein U9O87_00465 [Verrucomicrobiota bacterium]|nr:hypothetical protein [Verrucomicrobiota bacterium]
MGIYIRTFEFFMFVSVWIIIFHKIKKKPLSQVTVIVTSCLLVIFGELINEFVTNTTKYNHFFLIYLPKTKIPISIIGGGIIFSLGIYVLSEILGKNFIRKPPYFISKKNSSLIIQIIIILLFTIFAPLVELSGISMDLWHWQHKIALSLGWWIGIMKYYFIFLYIPALFGVFISYLSSNKIKK